MPRATTAARQTLIGVAGSATLINTVTRVDRATLGIKKLNPSKGH
jgi:hypothetical protein